MPVLTVYQISIALFTHAGGENGCSALLCGYINIKKALCQALFYCLSKASNKFGFPRGGSCPQTLAAD